MSSRNKKSRLYAIDPQIIQSALDSSRTWSEVGNKLGVEVYPSTMRRVIEHHHLSTTNLKRNLIELRKENSRSNRFENLSFDELIKSTSSRLTIKRYILRHNLIEYKCQIKECGNTGFHLGSKLSLQLDHIDGDNSNNILSNLRFLCPNCHSQTDTYGSKNVKRIAKPVNERVNRNKFDVSFEELSDLVKTTSLRQIGKRFGVSDNAIRKRCIKLGIEF